MITIPSLSSNIIRYAYFAKIQFPSETLRLSTLTYSLTNPSIDTMPFDGIDRLLSIGDVKYSILPTSDPHNINLSAVITSETAGLFSSLIKGSPVQVWLGFFDENSNLITTQGVGGFIQHFKGIVIGSTASLKYSDGRDAGFEESVYEAAMVFQCSNNILSLQSTYPSVNTSSASWKTLVDSTDTLMDRVSTIQVNATPFGG